MLCILPFDIVRSTNEWFLEAIKWRGLGAFKVSLVQSVFRELVQHGQSTSTTSTFFVATLIYI